MRKTIIRYGMYSVVTLLVFGGIDYLIAGKNPDYGVQEILGYISIFLSMIFVFAGIKHYRDKVNGGTITYLRALKLGCLMVLLPSIAFGLFDVIYVKYLDTGFMEKYYADAMAQMKATLPAAEYLAKSKQMEQEKAMMGSALFQFIVMTITVLAIGVAVAAISALMLQKKPKKLNQ